MGQVFNKGLDPHEKEEGLLKVLKNIKDKIDNRLRANGGQKNVEDGVIDNQLQPTKVQKINWVHKPAKDLDTLMNEINKIKSFKVINNKIINLDKLKKFLKDVINQKIKNKKDAEKRYLDDIYNDRKLIQEEMINRPTPAGKKLKEIIDNVILAVFGPDFIKIQANLNMDDKKKTQLKIFLR